MMRTTDDKLYNAHATYYYLFSKQVKPALQAQLDNGVSPDFQDHLGNKVRRVTGASQVRPANRAREARLVTQVLKVNEESLDLPAQLDLLDETASQEAEVGVR